MARELFSPNDVTRTKYYLSRPICEIRSEILVGNRKFSCWSLFVFQVDDQMKLLQDSWSEMLILDHMHHRMHNNLPDETQLPNGQVENNSEIENVQKGRHCLWLKQDVSFFLESIMAEQFIPIQRENLQLLFLLVQKFELLSLALLGVPSMAEKFLEISDNLKQLCFDSADYVCLKFILLLNAGKRKERDSRNKFFRMRWNINSWLQTMQRYR